MIGAQVSANPIEGRGRDVLLNCDTDGAKWLIEVLQNFIDRQRADHEHVATSDGWHDEPFVSSDRFELANGLDINFRP